MPTTVIPAPRRWTPWTLRQRPDGQWEVTQADRQTGRLTRFGPFKVRDEARHLAADLNGEEAP